MNPHIGRPAPRNLLHPACLRPILVLMGTPQNSTTAPAKWLADLLASNAEIERGEHLPMQPAFDRMHAAIKRIEDREADADQREG